MSKELDWSFSNLQEHSSSHPRREITSQAVGLIAGFGSLLISTPLWLVLLLLSGGAGVYLQ